MRQRALPPEGASGAFRRAMAGAVALALFAAPHATLAAESDLIEQGRDLYADTCATCHGRDGRGDGPVASALRVRPPDLTTIARRNGGSFRREQVEIFVTGDQVRLPSAHGSTDMPVWGPIFRALDVNDTKNKVRVANIVDYIGSIQVK